ncbi:MAG: flagellar biosynthesis anti-sigma factor FlgM [Coriobacteriia bacterium]
MIISQEQVQRAVEYLRTPAGSGAAFIHARTPETVSPELLRRVHEAIDCCPDLREDRIARGKALVADGSPSCDQVAEKMIGRIVSDSLR